MESAWAKEKGGKKSLKQFVFRVNAHYQDIQGEAGRQINVSLAVVKITLRLLKVHLKRWKRQQR